MSQESGPGDGTRPGVRSRLYSISGFREKTLWDWMVLLIVPAVLGFGVLLFNFIQATGEKSRADAREQFDRLIAADQESETALQIYFDGMAELLLDNGLKESDTESVTRNVARARTVTTLIQLDVGRKGELIVFLRESGLLEVPTSVSTQRSIVHLAGADLSNISLFGRDISMVNLSYSQMDEADMQHADVSGSAFRCTGLVDARMFATVARNTDFTRARMRGVAGSSVDFRGAVFESAEMSNADFSNSNFTSAVFLKANIIDSDLRGSNITDEQLAQASFVFDTILPDGTLLTEAMWPEFKALHGGGEGVARGRRGPPPDTLVESAEQPDPENSCVPP